MCGGRDLSKVAWEPQELSKVLVCCPHHVSLTFVNLLLWGWGGRCDKQVEGYPGATVSSQYEPGEGD